MNDVNKKQEDNTITILGIDLGTSGLRACIVRKTVTKNNHYNEEIVLEHSISIPTATKNITTNIISHSPKLWTDGIEQLFTALKSKINLDIVTHIILDATSSTVLLFNPVTKSFTEALMYNDDHAQNQAIKIKQTLELEKTKHSIHLKQNQNGAYGASSTLAKVMSLLETNPTNENTVICHQVDYLNHFLCGVLLNVF